MSIDYTNLDAAITATISASAPIGFTAMCVAEDVRKHSEALRHTERQGQAWRIVDRRLQALRKAGKIRYQRKPEGWVLA